LKVLVIDNTPGMGGSIHQLAHFLKSLSTMGIQFRVIASNPELFEGLVPEDVPIGGLSWPGFKNVFENSGAMFKPILPGVLNKPLSLLAYRRLAGRLVPEFLEIFRAFGPDVLHINNLNLPNKVFSDAIAGEKPPMMLSALMIRLFSRREAAFAARARAITCVSKAVADNLAKTMPSVSPERLVVVESPVDPERYVVERDPAVRAELGIPADAPLVLSLGRMIPWKGHDVLVRALADVPDVWLLQAGGDEPGWRGEIDRLAKEVGMSGRMVCAGARPDVPRLLAASDLVAHSSKFGRPEDGVVEAFGRVIVEGMAAGLPVVATDAGGASEILRGSEAGTLVPPGDAKAMSEAIRAFLFDSEAARRAGRVGREEAASRFSEKVLSEKMLRAYQDLIG